MNKQRNKQAEETTANNHFERDSSYTLGVARAPSTGLTNLQSIPNLNITASASVLTVGQLEIHCFAMNERKYC